MPDKLINRAFWRFSQMMLALANGVSIHTLAPYQSRGHGGRFPPQSRHCVAHAKRAAVKKRNRQRHKANL